MAQVGKSGLRLQIKFVSCSMLVQLCCTNAVGYSMRLTSAGTP